MDNTENLNNQNNTTKRIFYLILFLAVVLAGFLCKTMSTVIIPVVLSFMLSFVFLPIIKKLNVKTGIPWVISSLIIVILFFVAILGLTSILVTSLTGIISEYPKYENRFMSIYQLIAQNLDIEIDNSKSLFQNLWTSLKVREYTQKLAVMLSSGVISFSKTIFLISIMTAFILIEMRLTKRKMHYAFKDNKAKISRISHQIINQTVRYISIKFFISLSTGILCGLASLIIGLDFPIVWGFLAFIMNFIPIFGSIISVGFTTLFSLLQFYPNWGKTVFVLVFMTSVNMILGNILEPRIEGNNLGISPVMILISLSLWGYIWGLTGMLLAVPLMVIIKIVCENIDYLKGLAIIIGNDPRQQFQAQAQSQDKLENETLDSAQTETQPDSETN